MSVVDSNASAGERWDHVRELMEAESVAFTGETASRFRLDPRGVLTELNLYKFAAKLLGKRRRVADLGCGEGLGTWLLAKECGAALGLSAVERPEILDSRWSSEEVSFAPLDAEPTPCEALVCFRPALLELPKDLLSRIEAGGLALLGLPEAPAEAAAWAEVLRANFDHVFLFSAPACPIRPWGSAPPGGIALACGALTTPS